MGSPFLKLVSETDEERVVPALRAGDGRPVVLRDDAAQGVPAAAEGRAQRELVAQLEVLRVLEVRVDREEILQLEAERQREPQLRGHAGAGVRLIGGRLEVVREVGEA